MRTNGDIAAARAEIETMYREFLEGDGRLPEDFSFAYDRTAASGYILRGTPFDAYLDGLWDEVDSLRNMSNISEWVRLSAGAEINAAAAALVTWVKKTREMTEVLQEKCRIGHTTIMMPVFPCCTRILKKKYSAAICCIAGRVPILTKSPFCSWAIRTWFQPPMKAGAPVPTAAKSLTATSTDVAA